MNQAKFLAPIVLIALILLIYAFTFTVHQTEVAIKLRLGEIVDSEYEPGLHFMVPVVNNIKKFDRRIQTLDSRPQRFLTVEKKDVIVDSFAKWRITNPGQFFRSTGGDSMRTARLLSERVNTALRDEFGKRTIQEVVSEERMEIMEILRKKIDTNAAELGIEVVDVRVKKIDLPPEVSESVYQRMRAERERVARDLRAQGAEAAERIRADADRQRTVILANAYRESETLRGEGDAKAAEIYANAFNQNRDFFSFYRSLTAYRKAFQEGGDVLVLEPDSDFFRFFNEKLPAGRESGPQTVAAPGKSVGSSHDPDAQSDPGPGEDPMSASGEREAQVGSGAPEEPMSPSREERERTRPLEDSPPADAGEPSSAASVPGRTFPAPRPVQE